MKYIYKGEDLPTVLFPWQIELKKLFEGGSSTAPIHVKIRSAGGKSEICKKWSFEEIVMGIPSSDLKTCKAVWKKWPDYKVYIFDESWLIPISDKVIELAEQIKSSPNQPQVIVFSRFDLSRSGWDRYRVDGNSSHLLKVDV